MKKYVLIFVMLLTCFVGLNCGAESKCDAESLDFQTENVYLMQGKTVIEGTFHNRGDVGARVTKIELSINANDMAGNHLFHDSGVFSNVNAWVPAHGNTSWTFTINNSAARGYKGKYKWSCQKRFLGVDYDKPAANSGQPQKPTDNRITINQLDLDGEYEVVEVGTHPDYGDIWAETLGATVKFFRMCDAYKAYRKGEFDEDIFKWLAEEKWLVGGVIKSPSGSTHFTHKETSECDKDWLLWLYPYDYESKYNKCCVYRWSEEDNTAHHDMSHWGFSVEGDYLEVWRVSGFSQQGHAYRGENGMVLKRIK